ncbi:MAG: YkgJ family cysteine cluster protein [Desulfobacterales bacterium]|nr:YkgJ family cysteine cluster protein [Desulfobacterales bacterium]
MDLHHKNITQDDLFTCKKCGECCTGYGGTYLTEQDISAISTFLTIPEHQFLREYCVLSGNRYLISQAKNNKCVFWDKLCTIHAVKPKMCRQWPFIESVLMDTQNWYIMAQVCPGMRNDIPENQIRHILYQVMRTTT